MAYKPFNHKLHDRIFELARQEEDLLSEIARLKTDVPGDVATAFGERMVEGIRADDTALEAARRNISVRPEGHDELDAAVGGEVEERLRMATQGLARLKREMPAAVAKMERARVAGEYVMTQGR